MLIPQDADLSWAMTKAFVIVLSGVSAVVCLAWAGAKKLFPK